MTTTRAVEAMISWEARQDDPPTEMLSVSDAMRALHVVDQIPSIVSDTGLRMRLRTPGRVTVREVITQLAVVADAYTDALNDREIARGELHALRRDIDTFRRVLGTSAPDA